MGGWLVGSRDIDEGIDGWLVGWVNYGEWVE